MKASLAISVPMCIVAICGCISQPSLGLPPGGEGRLSVVQAVESLLVDPMFAEKYNNAAANAKRAGKVRPVVTIMPIENNADNRGDAATRQVGRRLQVAMRKTGKFDIIDPDKRKRMVDVVVGGADSGEKIAANGVQCYGDYDPADFVMTGELVRETSGEFSLNLDMVDTRDGKLFWNEVVTPSDSLTR